VEHAAQGEGTSGWNTPGGIDLGLGMRENLSVLDDRLGCNTDEESELPLRFGHADTWQNWARPN